MSLTYAKLIDAVPNVANTSDRDARYPSPDKYQKVYIIASNSIQQWDGAAWQTIFLGTGTAGSYLFAGTGSPEGSVTAPVGGLYLQTDGANGQVLWVKRSGTGNTGWALISTTLGYYNVMDFGAKGDNSTDDTTAISAAVTAVNALVVSNSALGQSVTLYFPAAKAYRCSANLVIKAGVHVQMDAPLVYTGSAHSPAITYGATQAAGIGTMRKLVFRVQRTTNADWTNTGDVGLKIINAQNCDIRIEQCAAFTIGAQFVGSGAGVQYNRVGLGYFVDNKYHLDLVNTNDGGVGWVNENEWIGGNFSNSTATHPGVSRYGVRFTSTTADQYNNNNVFLKPSFQLNATDAGAGEAIPVLAEYAQQNHILSARSEGNSPTVARETNASTENTYQLGYNGSLSALTVDNQSSAPVTLVQNSRRVKLDQPGKLLFHSGPLQKLGCYYDGATALNFPTVHVSTVAASAPALTNASGFTLNNNYVETTTSRAFGIYVSCLAQTEIVVRRDCEASHYGKVYVAAFDASDTQLQDGTGPLSGGAWIRGSSGEAATWSTNQGGSYFFSDSADDVFFKVGAGVQYLRVMIANGVSSLRIRSFSVYGTDQNGGGVAWTGFDDQVYRGNIGTTFPTAGTWTRGRIVWNATPTPTGVVSWVCTTAGSPGTWSPMSGGDAFLASPTFTGTPAAPTAAPGTNTTQIATTAFVATSFAPLASPTFSGTPSLPTGTTGITQTAKDNSTKLATTAYVDRAPGSGNITSAAPAGTSSATAVMMGVNSGASIITPTKSGIVTFTASGQMANATAASGATVDLRTSTGTGPANAAAVTGTLRGIAQTNTSVSAAQKSGFNITVTVTGLTVGQAYWADLSLLAPGGTGTATVTGVTINAVENV